MTQDINAPVSALRRLLRRPPAYFWVVSALVFVGALLAVVIAGGPAYIDLQVYRFGAQALLDGRDIYDPQPQTTAGIGLPFLYPPWAAVIMVPMAIIPLAVANVAMFALSVAALALTLYLVARRMWPAGERRGAFAVTSIAVSVAFAFEPIWATLHFGQVNIWLMALVAADCLVPHPKWPRGMLVGIAIAIKVTPGAFLLFFLLRKDFRAVLVAVLTVIATAAIGFLAGAESSTRYWLTQLFDPSGMGGSTFATNQSIIGALNRLSLPPTLNKILTVAVIGAVLVALVLIMRRVSVPVALMVNAIGGLLISPISWSHHWVWCAPIILLAVGKSVRDRQWWPPALLTLALFVIAPLHLAPADDDRELHWNWWQEIAGNSYLLGALIALGVTAVYVYRRDPHTLARAQLR